MTNIRDFESYLSSVWDWTPFNECFAPTNIRITDIDGFVERNGLFLVIETKKPTIKIPLGQQIMFNRMVQTGLFTVLIIWGDPNKPIRALKLDKAGREEYVSCDVSMLKVLIRNWFGYADQGGVSLKVDKTYAETLWDSLVKNK